MKKMTLTMFAGILFAFCKAGVADPIFITPVQPDPFSILGGQVTGALITHVQAVDQVTTKGNKIALLDSVLLMGHLKQDYIAHTRFGYNATRNSDGTFTGGGFQVSEFIPINNVVGSLFVVPDQYEFIKGLQFGPAFGYDFQAHHDFFSIDIGWQYGPNTTK